MQVGSTDIHVNQRNPVSGLGQMDGHTGSHEALPRAAFPPSDGPNLGVIFFKRRLLRFHENSYPYNNENFLLSQSLCVFNNGILTSQFLGERYTS
jgi:hypothetical protein